MGNLIQDLRYGLRMLAKNPGFTAVAVITLALGIGASTVMFSVINATLLRPLPYHDADRLVAAFRTQRQKGSEEVGSQMSAAEVSAVRDNNPVFDNATAFQWTDFILTNGEQPEDVGALKVSANYLSLLGARPLIGRDFSKEEEQPGRGYVAIITDSLWRRRFHSDPRMVGKDLILNSRIYTVIGILPPKFEFPWSSPQDLLVPATFDATQLSDGDADVRLFLTLARLKHGTTLTQAQSVLDIIARRLELERPETNRGWSLKVAPLAGLYYSDDFRQALYLLFGAVGLVLLIACANVANLLLARVTTRQREAGIRLAMGATRSRLLGQFLSESLVLAAMSGVAGVLMADWGKALLVAAVPHDYLEAEPGLRDLHLDGYMLGFGVLVSMLTGVLFGLAPALRASKPDLNSSLKGGGRTSSVGFASRRLQKTLAIAEVTLATVLALGAGLLVRSLARLLKMDLGFNPKDVVALDVSLPETRYPKPSRQLTFYREALRRLVGAPGVVSASLTADVPLQGAAVEIFFAVEGQPNPVPGAVPRAEQVVISPDYFRTIGASLVKGRDFSERDREGSTPVCIVDESLARRNWPNREAVGGYLKVVSQIDEREGRQREEKEKLLQVIGVVHDIKQEWVATSMPQVYVPYFQVPIRDMTFVVRTTSRMDVLPAVRDAIGAVDRGLPIVNVRSLEQVRSGLIAQIRFPMILVWIFAGIALLLSAAGIFAVMSYSVAQRAHEMAIRMALGAQAGDVFKLVLADSLVIATLGTAAGLTGGVALKRILAVFLYGVQPNDPLTMVAVSLLLVVIAVMSGFIPARRATKIDPMVALRCE